jgi:hypothetical protein
MSFVKALFKSKKEADLPPESVLAAWQDYSGSTPERVDAPKDVETGGGQLFVLGVSNSASNLMGTISRATSGIARATSREQLIPRRVAP